MKSSTYRTLSVARSKDGSWSISGPVPGSKRAKAFPTKAAAVKAAQTLAREGGGVVSVRHAGGVGKTFTLGRLAMTKLNAVEGVVLGAAGRKAFAAFDRADASPAQRRAALRKDLAKLAVGLKYPDGASRDSAKRSGPKD